MRQPYRIVIVEDHEMVRAGLRAMISGDTDLEIVGEAEDGHKAMHCIDQMVPDLAIVDLSLPKMNGVDLIAEIKRRQPETKILVLSAHATDAYVREAFQAGSDGYVSKADSSGELKLAIKVILDGKKFVSPTISQWVLSGFVNGDQAKKKGGGITLYDTLSPREKQILNLIAEGLSIREVGANLFISVKTAQTHRANIMRKLDLHSSQALTVFAINNGLIQRGQGARENG